MKCRICDNAEGNRTHAVRDMMFAPGDTFDYLECADCGCLQIAEVPADMSRYYPPDYCSFKRSLHRRFENPLKRLLRLPRYRYAVTGQGLLGRLLYPLSPKPKLKKLSRIALSQESRILDVGCGTGSLLYKLREIGFGDLLGVDAFIDRDVEYPNGLRILRQTIDRVEGDGAWDLVMFNYSLEHMPDQQAAMRHAARLVAPGGRAFVQIPLASSWAWQHYGVHWVQLDAPRHLYLHTPESFRRVAEEAGFRIDEVVYDSDDFQFWGSEQYANGIPLKSDRSWSEDRARSMFTESDIRSFRRKAVALNREKRGDQAAFYLTKA